MEDAHFQAQSDCEPSLPGHLQKNDFYWSAEHQQAFAQIKQEIAHAVTLGPVRMGPEVKNMLYSAAGEPWLVLEPVAEGAWGNSRLTSGILEPKLQRV